MQDRAGARGSALLTGSLNMVGGLRDAVPQGLIEGSRKQFEVFRAH